MTSQVLAIAICPERHLGDNSLTAVASVTHTYVSNDLQVSISPHEETGLDRCQRPVCLYTTAARERETRTGRDGTGVEGDQQAQGSLG